MLRQIFEILKKDFFLSITYKFNFFFQFFAWFFALLMWYFLSKLIPQESFRNTEGYFPFVISGISLQSLLATILLGNTSRVREHMLMGNLEFLLNILKKPYIFLISGFLYDLINSLLRIFLIIFASSFFFSFPLKNFNIILFLISLLLSSFSFSAIGNLSASFVLIFRKGEPFSFFFNMLFSLFGGVFFPINLLPKILQKLSYFLPMTQGLILFRASFFPNQNKGEIYFSLTYFALFFLIFYTLSLYIFNLAYKYGKKKGNLSTY